MIAKVIVDISNSNVDRVFDYIAIDSVAVGSRVSVPFANREIEGYCIELCENTDVPADKLKTILRTLDERPIITAELMQLMNYLTKRAHLRKIDVLRLFLPSKVRGGRVKELTRKFVTLSAEYENGNPADFISSRAIAQREAFEYVKECGRISLAELCQSFSAAAVRNLTERGVFIESDEQVRRIPYNKIIITDNEVELTNEQEDALNEIVNSNGIPVLLHGVTGSGKTEVYLRCIEKTLAEGKNAIMLVPEISLTPQAMHVLRSRFKDTVALIHSGLNDGERFDEWRRILQNEARIVVGARSAIFAPIENVGLIVVDEEHDSSYVSDSNPRYDAKDVAGFRARYNNATLVLGSATPSIETYYDAKQGNMKIVNMPNRINQRPLPKTEVVNMCNEVMAGNNTLYSKKLIDELTECVQSGNQAMLFINRRGYSSYVMCHSCGYVAKCEDCDVSLVYHKEENVLKCHFCQRRYAMPTVCPMCKSDRLKRGFVGTEQVAEYMEQLFPTVGVLRLDNDTTSTKDSHYKILSDFRARKAQILVGTQMITKGHDFPAVTLVGILDADKSLHYSDYRSVERTFQLITQVSGRAGRENKEGKVILQTYTPNHYVYKYAVANDYQGFYEREINIMEATKFPPFSVLVRVLCSHENESVVSDYIKKAFTAIQKLQENTTGFLYLNAMKSPVKRIKTKYRMQILMRLDKRGYTETLDKIYNLLDNIDKKDASVFIELNPNDLS